MTSATLILLLLVLQGKDAEQLRETARSAPEGPERRALFLKALRLDLDQGDGCLANWIVRSDLHLTDPLREELVTIYREAAGKDGGRPWIHLGLMQLYVQQGRKEESLKHARVVADLLQEGKPTLGPYDTLA